MKKINKDHFYIKILYKYHFHKKSFLFFIFFSHSCTFYNPKNLKIFLQYTIFFRNIMNFLSLRYRLCSFKLVRYSFAMLYSSVNENFIMIFTDNYSCKLQRSSDRQITAPHELFVRSNEFAKYCSKILINGRI